MTWLWDALQLYHLLKSHFLWFPFWFEPLDLHLFNQLLLLNPFGETIENCYFSCIVLIIFLIPFQGFGWLQEIGKVQINKPQMDSM